ncbi:unnamed protein product [Pleuronectes platessa]|uniref:Uncharacterized protein n=1 Tax=Pleuronectes platessa TaxID=8262 RepID=A0A9N7VE61_PLEPL|nr:unnamed protein product [Pleuronectes platessa]
MFTTDLCSKLNKQMINWCRGSLQSRSLEEGSVSSGGNMEEWGIEPPTLGRSDHFLCVCTYAPLKSNRHLVRGVCILCEQTAHSSRSLGSVSGRTSFYLDFHSPGLPPSGFNRSTSHKHHQSVTLLLPSCGGSQVLTAAAFNLDCEVRRLSLLIPPQKSKRGHFLFADEGKRERVNGGRRVEPQGKREVLYDLAATCKWAPSCSPLGCRRGVHKHTLAHAHPFQLKDLQRDIVSPPHWSSLSSQGPAGSITQR